MVITYFVPVFAHENQACLPCLSNIENLRHYSKSDLVACIQTTNPDQVVPDYEPVVGAEVMDAAASVHMLSHKGVRTNLIDYAVCVFMPYIRRHLLTVNMVDIV